MSMSETQQIEKRRTPANTLAELLMGQKDQIALAIPKHMTADRMLRVSMTALRTTPKLAECTPQSFLSCVMSAAQLGLEPNTPLGHCYLIPRKNNKTKVTECTLLIGYQGMQDLARRSGQLRRIHAYVVREGDHFTWTLGINPDIQHTPASGNESKPITHAYAVARLKDGDDVFAVLTRGEIEKRRKRGASGSGVKTPWDTDYDAMALKSAVRALWTFLPKSAEMAMAVSVEEAHERAFVNVPALPRDPSVSLLAELNGDPQPSEPADDETMVDDPSEAGCGADEGEAA